jgi:hypothetical protein
MRGKKMAIALTTTSIALTTMAATAPVASASGGGGVRSSGVCSAGATWKLKAAPDDGRIQVEFEVDTNRVGQTWSARITDNTVQVFSGTRVTQAPSGSFEIRRLVANRAGVDHFVATARNAASGQTCRGTLNF